MAFAAKFNPKCLVGSCLLELGEIMRREGQRFILEVNGFDGSDVSPFVRGADESQCQRATRSYSWMGREVPC
jgi:hypothetical protein